MINKEESKMNIKRPFKIIGTGTYLPENHVPSEDIEVKYGIRKGFSEKYSGVKARYKISDETNGTMAAAAVQQAMDNANVSINDIDLLISGSATFDYILPNQASMVKYHLKDCETSDCGCVDVNTTCLSFLASLDLASRYLDGVQYKKIVVVSSEISSKGLNPENWEIVTLFGDAAAAVVIEYDESANHGAIHYDMVTYSEAAKSTIVEGGGNVNHPSEVPYSRALHSFTMEGKDLLRMAKDKIPEFMSRFFAPLPTELEELDFIIPHQASKAGIMLFEHLYDFSNVNILKNLSTHGNCIAASMPTVLVQNIQNKTLKQGDTVMLTGTAAGFSIGGILIKI